MLYGAFARAWVRAPPQDVRRTEKRATAGKSHSDAEQASQLNVGFVNFSRISIFSLLVSRGFPPLQNTFTSRSRSGASALSLPGRGFVQLWCDPAATLNKP